MHLFEDDGLVPSPAGTGDRPTSSAAELDGPTTMTVTAGSYGGELHVTDDDGGTRAVTATVQVQTPTDVLGAILGELDERIAHDIAAGHDALVARDYDTALDAFHAATQRARSTSCGSTATERN